MHSFPLCPEDTLIPSAAYPAQTVPPTLRDARTGMCVGAEGSIRQAWPSLLIRKEVLFSPFEVIGGFARPTSHTEVLFCFPFPRTVLCHSRITLHLCGRWSEHPDVEGKKNLPGKRFKCHLLGISPHYTKGDKDKLGKTHPSPLTYDPKWVMSGTGTGATASARHGKTICLPRAMLKARQKQDESRAWSLLGGRCGPKARHVLNGATEQGRPPTVSGTVQCM